MTNQEVIKKFLNREEGKTPKRQITNGYYTYEGRTLQTIFYNDRIELLNYSTVIAKLFDNGELHININKYSKTTSKIQTKLIALANLTNYKIKAITKV